MIEYYHLPTLAKTYNIPYHYLYFHLQRGSINGKIVLVGREKKAIFVLWDEKLEALIQTYLQAHRYPTLYRAAEEYNVSYKKLILLTQTGAFPELFLTFPKSNRIFVNVDNPLWGKVVSYLNKYEWWRVALLLGKNPSLNLPQIDIEVFERGHSTYIALNQKRHMSIDFLSNLLETLRDVCLEREVKCVIANVYKNVKTILTLCLSGITEIQ